MIGNEVKIRIKGVFLDEDSEGNYDVQEIVCSIGRIISIKSIGGVNHTMIKLLCKTGNRCMEQRNFYCYESLSSIKRSFEESSNLYLKDKLESSASIKIDEVL